MLSNRQIAEQVAADHTMAPGPYFAGATRRSLTKAIQAALDQKDDLYRPGVDLCREYRDECLGWVHVARLEGNVPKQRAWQNRVDKCDAFLSGLSKDSGKDLEGSPSSPKGSAYTMDPRLAQMVELSYTNPAMAEALRLQIAEERATGEIEMPAFEGIRGDELGGGSK